MRRLRITLVAAMAISAVAAPAFAAGPSTEPVAEPIIVSGDHGAAPSAGLREKGPKVEETQGLCEIWAWLPHCEGKFGWERKR